MISLAELEGAARCGDPAAHLALARLATSPDDGGSPIWWAALQAATEAAQAGCAEAVHVAAEAAFEHMLESADDDPVRREWCIRWNALAVRTGNDSDAARWRRAQRRMQALRDLFGVDAKAEARAAKELQDRLYAPQSVGPVN